MPRPKSTGTVKRRTTTRAAKPLDRTRVLDGLAYPFPLPMTREVLVRALADLGALRALRAPYLCFFFLPVEERIGEWRFAGTATDAGTAFERLGAYASTMGLGPRVDMLEGEVLEVGSPETAGLRSPGATFQDEWPEPLPPYRVIVYAVGGAPYDDFGIAILEANSLGPFEGRAPDTRRPDEWPDE